MCVLIHDFKPFHTIQWGWPCKNFVALMKAIIIYYLFNKSKHMQYNQYATCQRNLFCKIRFLHNIQVLNEMHYFKLMHILLDVYELCFTSKTPILIYLCNILPLVYIGVSSLNCVFSSRSLSRAHTHTYIWCILFILYTLMQRWLIYTENGQTHVGFELF